MIYNVVSPYPESGNSSQLLVTGGLRNGTAVHIENIGGLYNDYNRNEKTDHGRLR